MYETYSKYGFEPGSEFGVIQHAIVDLTPGNERVDSRVDRLGWDEKLHASEESYYRKQDGFEVCGFKDEGRPVEVVTSPNGALTVFC